MPLYAQSRGVYPLGMTATSSGVSGEAGVTYSNQLLFYSRDASKDEHGDTIATGHHAVVMDLNSFVWVSRREILGGARYSATVTLPVARNALTSDIHGTISGGSAFADSYYLPFILGWNKERAAVRVLYGFLAPTGRFAPDATDNVGSGYWTSTVSSGQTVYLTRDKQLNASAFEMYEFHTMQEGTATRPGDTFNVDYSIMQTLRLSSGPWRLHVGLVGYEQRQTTARTGPSVPSEQAAERYMVHAVGVGSNATFPDQRVSLGSGCSGSSPIDRRSRALHFRFLAPSASESDRRTSFNNQRG